MYEYGFGNGYSKNRESRNKKCMIPCVRTRIRLRIRKRLFWSDHVRVNRCAGLPLTFVTSCAIFRHFSQPVEKTMPNISKITREETEQVIELVRVNVPLSDQSSSDYGKASFISMTASFCVVYTKQNKVSSTSYSLRQASNNGLEWTGAMTNGEGEKRREMHSPVCNIVIIIIYPLTARVVEAPQMISQPVSSNLPVLYCPLGLAELQVCPFPDVVFPPLPLPAVSSSPFHCALQDGFGQTWWTADMTIPLQIASLYDVCINTTKKRTQFHMPLTCQSCAYTELLKDAVPHAVSVSVQMDSHLNTASYYLVLSSIRGFPAWRGIHLSDGILTLFYE